jgi:pyruvate dehydrogenase E1 component alpha subunit
LSIGQESVAVIISEIIRQGDLVFGNHRSHAHFLALGGSPYSLFSEVLGKESGCSGGRGGSMHITSPQNGFVGSMPIVGGTIPIAAGAALQLRRTGRNLISVVFFGDGATEEGVFHETLNLASKFDLPILFVCENNSFSSHLHIDERQVNRNLSRFAEAHEIEHSTLDGNDYLVDLNLTQKAAEKVRQGRPYFLEFLTYRWMGHVGHFEDLDIGKDRERDLEIWKDKDQLKKIRQILVECGVLTHEALDNLESETTIEIQDSYKNAFNSKWPENIYKYEIGMR